VQTAKKVLEHICQYNYKTPVILESSNISPTAGQSGPRRSTREFIDLCYVSPTV
jgi:hypothetical protein